MVNCAIRNTRRRCSKCQSGFNVAFRKCTHTWSSLPPTASAAGADGHIQICRPCTRKSGPHNASQNGHRVARRLHTACAGSDGTCDYDLNNSFKMLSHDSDHCREPYTIRHCLAWRKWSLAWDACCALSDQPCIWALNIGHPCLLKVALLRDKSGKSSIDVGERGRGLPPGQLRMRLPLSSQQ